MESSLCESLVDSSLEIGVLLKEKLAKTVQYNVLSLRCLLQNPNIAFRDNLDLIFEVKNTTLLQVPPETVFQVTSEGSYLTENWILTTPLEIGETLSFSLTLKPYANNGLSGIAKKIKVSVYHKATQLKTNVLGFKLETRFFTKELTLRHAEGTQSVVSNILLVGMAGHGKSSFFNRILSLSSENIDYHSITLNTDSHVTKGLRREPMPGLENVFFIDTPGLNDHEASSFETNFESILKKSILYEQDLLSDPGIISAINGSKKSTHDEITCAIFVLKKEILYSNEDIKDRVRNMIKLLNDCGITCLCAITHGDEFETHSSKAHAVNDVHAELGFNLRDTYVVNNNVLEAKKNKEEFILFRILSRALEASKMSQYHKNKIPFSKPAAVSMLASKAYIAAQNQKCIHINEEKRNTTVTMVVLRLKEPFANKLPLSVLRAAINDQASDLGYDFQFVYVKRNTLVRPLHEQHLNASYCLAGESALTLNGATIMIREVASPAPVKKAAAPPPVSFGCSDELIEEEKLAAPEHMMRRSHATSNNELKIIDFFKKEPAPKPERPIEAEPSLKSSIISKMSVSPQKISVSKIKRTAPPPLRATVPKAADYSEFTDSASDTLIEESKAEIQPKHGYLSSTFVNVFRQ